MGLVTTHPLARQPGIARDVIPVIPFVWIAGDNPTDLAQDHFKSFALDVSEPFPTGFSPEDPFKGLHSPGVVGEISVGSAPLCEDRLS